MTGSHKLHSTFRIITSSIVPNSAPFERSLDSFENAVTNINRQRWKRSCGARRIQEREGPAGQTPKVQRPSQVIA